MDSSSIPFTQLQAKYDPAETMRLLEIQEQAMALDLVFNECWLSDNLES
jgi:hypothetical protein